MKNLNHKSTLKVLTYNVHGCKGTDGKISIGRIAEVINQYKPDLVALQELDINCKRSGEMDQPYWIAQHLEMMCHFHPSIQLEKEQYGNAILSRYPMRLVKALKLPSASKLNKSEPRGALWVSVKIKNFEIQFINTHLGLGRKERNLQVDALLSEDWLRNKQCHNPIVFCGDFNSWAASSVCRKIKDMLNDAQILEKNHKPKATWPSLFPFSRIDHIFFSKGVEVQEILAPNTKLNRQASDHLPLIVNFRI